MFDLTSSPASLIDQERFVKHVEDGIFELIAEHGGNIFREFFIFDEGNITYEEDTHLNGCVRNLQKAVDAVKQYKDDFTKAWHEYFDEN